MSERIYITVETRPFIEDATQCLQDDEREAFIEYIACNPTAGVLIPGTGGSQGPLAGGWSREAGRARVIYYYHSERIPLFLLTAYSKSRQADLSPPERAAMRRIVAEIVKQYTHAPARHR